MFWLKRMPTLYVFVCICCTLSSRGAAARWMPTKRPTAGIMPTAAATATATTNADGKSKDNGHSNWETIETKRQSQWQSPQWQSQWKPQPQQHPQQQPQTQPPQTQPQAQSQTQSQSQSQSQSPQPRLIESFDHRFLDGHYEYRYVLSNGDTRHEHAYWLPVGKTKVLARKGFYSAPMSNNKFLTVFYTVDQNGHRENSYTLSAVQPTLPRTVNVPVTAIVRSDADSDMETSMAAAAADVGETGVHVKRNSMTTLQAGRVAQMVAEVAKGTTTNSI